MSVPLVALAGVISAYLVYVLAVAVYNLYLHPLSSLPGPRSWIVFPLLRHVAAVRGLYDARMREFHDYYGDVVRLNPNEVSFITSQAWKDIYGHGHKQLPKWRVKEPGRAASIIDGDYKDHSRFRKSLSHAFSEKALRSQENIMKHYIDLLVQKLKVVASSKDKTDMQQWYNLAIFDLIGDLAFGESFNGLETVQTHNWVTMMFSAVKVFHFIRMAAEYPLIGKLLPIIMNPKHLSEERAVHRAHTKSVVMRRVADTEKNGRGDFMDSMLKHRGEKDGITDEELETNSEILVIAGSETTATLLAGATYWLLQTPQAMQQVTAEVRQAFDSEEEIDFVSATAKLPYMLACLNETLRMYPPVPTGLSRITIDPITEISGLCLPAGCHVSVHQSAAYLSPRNFHDPLTFAPERWLAAAPAQFTNDNRSVFQPFSVGPRNCIGRNLAYNEMRLILARMLWNFDFRLCEESNEWYKQKSYTLWEKGPLMCTLKQRAC